MEKMKFSEFQKSYKDTKNYKKLKKLGIVRRWFKNIINYREDNWVNIMNDKYDFDTFILISFLWSESKEGYDYWDKLSKK